MSRVQTSKNNYYCIRYTIQHYQKKGPTPEEELKSNWTSKSRSGTWLTTTWKEGSCIFLVAWNLAHSGQVSCKSPAATWCSSFQSIGIFRVRVLVLPSKWLFRPNTKHTTLLHSLQKAKGTQHLRKNPKSPGAVNQRKASNAHPTSKADSFDVNMNYDTCITYKGSYNFYDEYYFHRLSLLITKGMSTLWQHIRLPPLQPGLAPERQGSHQKLRLMLPGSVLQHREQAKVQAGN